MRNGRNGCLVGLGMQYGVWAATTTIALVRSGVEWRPLLLCACPLGHCVPANPAKFLENTKATHKTECSVCARCGVACQFD